MGVGMDSYMVDGAGFSMNRCTNVLWLFSMNWVRGSFVTANKINWREGERKNGD